MTLDGEWLTEINDCNSGEYRARSYCTCMQTDVVLLFPLNKGYRQQRYIVCNGNISNKVLRKMLLFPQFERFAIIE